MWKYLAVSVIGMAIYTGSSSADQPAQPAPPGPGLELIQRSCINCHDIYMITTKRKTPDEWAALVNLMADRGAEVTPEEIDVIVEYLSQNFSSTPAAAAKP
jgi:mono/diheme cytochrome c family protein